MEGVTMKVLSIRTIAAALALGCAACEATSYSVYEPRDRGPARADITVELDKLAALLEERATLRVPLGSARVRVTDLEPVLSRESRHRFAVLEERDVDATQTTIRRELEIALAGRMNVIDPSVALAGDQPVAATHEVDGTFVRTGDDIEITLRLVDLRDGWIVATAGRRIFGFVPRDYVDPRTSRARRPEVVAGVEETAPIPAERVEPIGAAAPRDAIDRPGDAIVEDAAGDVGEAAEPDPTTSTADGVISPNTVIEFDVGPAASRLEALLGPSKPEGVPD